MELEQLRSIIAEALACDEEEVNPETALVDDLGADSLAVMEVVMALEEAAGIKIDDSEVMTLKTVADIQNYLAAHKN